MYLEGMEEASIFVHVAISDISGKVSGRQPPAPGEGPGHVPAPPVGTEYSCQPCPGAVLHGTPHLRPHSCRSGGALCLCCPSAVSVGRARGVSLCLCFWSYSGCVSVCLYKPAPFGAPRYPGAGACLGCRWPLCFQQLPCRGPGP